MVEDSIDFHLQKNDSMRLQQFFREFGTTVFPGLVAGSMATWGQAEASEMVSGRRLSGLTELGHWNRGSLSWLVYKPSMGGGSINGGIPKWMVYMGKSY